jgi:regulator of protease activity HflC (stomatin/prohibitin superfamily)
MLQKTINSNWWSFFIIIIVVLLMINPRMFFPVAIIAIIVYIFYKKLNLLKTKRSQGDKVMAEETYAAVSPKKAKKIIFIIIGAIIIVLVLIRALVVVGAGETGVYHLFGRVGDQELKSGLHLINPLAQVTKMSIRTEEYTMSITPTEGKKMGNDSITALTKEGLNVDLDITVLYHLVEDRASDVYKNLGLNYEEKVIRPAIRASIREVVAQYEAKDIYSEKREEATLGLENYLKQTIEDRGIEVEQVLLRNVNLPEKLANSIQEKLQAEQEAQRMKFVLEKESQEAERKRIEAAGQRDAQKIINESLSEQYLDYLYINSLKDRQGTIYVPTSPSSGMPVFKNIP